MRETIRCATFRTAVIALSATLLNALGIGSAHAITYDFSGTIDSGAFDPANGAGFDVGSPFSGFLEYDGSALVPTGSGSFSNGLAWYQFTLGNHTYEGSPEQTVYNPGSQSFIDPLPHSDSPLIFADDVAFFFSGLQGVPPVSLDTFNAATFGINLLLLNGDSHIVGGVQAEGTITSWARRAAVPEPGAAMLLVIGALAMRLGRRK